MSEIPNVINNQSIEYTFQTTWVPSLCVPNEQIEFYLSQNYPNPFNAETAIEYSIAKPGDVQVIVFDSLGRKVNVLVDKYINAAGPQKRIIWNGKDENGNSVSSGLYYCQIRQESNIETKQMILMK